MCDSFSQEEVFAFLPSLSESITRSRTFLGGLSITIELFILSISKHKSLAKIKNNRLIFKTLGTAGDVEVLQVRIVLQVEPMQRLQLPLCCKIILTNILENTTFVLGQVIQE